MSRTPYLEHCPECTPAVQCRPLTTRRASRDSVNAQYRCPRCLYSWRTSWLREPAPVNREDV
jgi:hypothetical protein